MNFLERKDKIKNVLIDHSILALLYLGIEKCFVSILGTFLFLVYFCGGQIGIELLLGIISGVRCKVILDTWYVDCFEDNEMFIGSR